MDDDTEVYSMRRFVQALSFKVGLVASLVVLVIVIAVVVILAGVLTGTVVRGGCPGDSDQCGSHPR